MIDANVQAEPAASYDVELAGQLAAIGIVKGKPFTPDERMERILTDAAAVGNATGRMLNWRYAWHIRNGGTTPAPCGETCCGKAARSSRRLRPSSPTKAFQAVSAHRGPHPRFAHRVRLCLYARLAGHDYADPLRGLTVPRWAFSTLGHSLSTATKPTK